MNILILEDEPPIASFIKNNCYEILGNHIKKISVFYTAEDAIEFLKDNSIDLCLLDLNLSGYDGFSFLKQVVSMPFQTIVISAYSDRAITAYEYGILDFVPKPFNRERLQLALDRYLGRNPVHSKMKYLIYKYHREYKKLDIKNILYLKSERVIVEAFQTEGRPVLLDKHLNQLELILPGNFLRVHRSFIANFNFIESFGRKANGNTFIKLENMTEIPVSRSRIKVVRDFLKSNL